MSEGLPLLSLQGDNGECYGSFDFTTSIIIIIVCCLLGIVWAIFNFIKVRQINVASAEATSSSSELVSNITDDERKLLVELGDKIASVDV